MHKPPLEVTRRDRKAAPGPELFIRTGIRLISQRLSGFERVGNSFLRFSLSAQANESFALQIENVLLRNRLWRRNAAARQYVCQFSCDHRVVVTGEFAANEHMDCQFRSGQEFL